MFRTILMVPIGGPAPPLLWPFLPSGPLRIRVLQAILRLTMPLPRPRAPGCAKAKSVLHRAADIPECGQRRRPSHLRPRRRAVAAAGFLPLQQQQDDATPWEGKLAPRLLQMSAAPRALRPVTQSFSVLKIRTRGARPAPARDYSAR